MGDDNEQRAQSAMASLSSSMHATSSNSPPLRLPSEVEKNATSPICRPWERADMHTRMASFKPTTWFGRPAPADPVACARKGWMNVELDMIGCQVCGSRLSFILPCNWTKQQVELAAVNFSEKLSSGHKANCPWKTSITQEELAGFAPTPASELVRDYDARMQALSALPAIPVVSSSSVQTMKASRAAELNFLLTPGDSVVLQDMDAAEGEAVQKLRENHESVCQAQKLISLCGWRLRDTRDSGSNASGSLECGLCGAIAGLWSFATLNRPSSSANAVLAKKEVSKKSMNTEPATTEDVRDNGSAGDNDKPSKIDHDVSPAKPLALDLCLTIAGGPRPIRTLYRPGDFPASLPIPGLFHQYKSELRKDAEQRGSSSKRARPEDDDESRKKARTEGPDQPTSQDGKSAKRMRVDEDDDRSKKKLKNTEGNASTRREGVPGCSSVNAVETSCQSKHENSAESVECSPQQSETLLSQEQDLHAQDGLCSVQATAKTLPEPGSLADGSGEFDPLFFHRSYCPWICTYRESGPCGWQRTIDALYSLRSPNKVESDLSSLARAPDPLASVRKLLGGKGKDTDKGKSVVVT